MFVVQTKKKLLVEKRRTDLVGSRMGRGGILYKHRGEQFCRIIVIKDFIKYSGEEQKTVESKNLII